MTTKLIMTRDINGYVDYILDDSDTKYNVNLGSGVAQSITTPIDAQRFNVFFSIEPGTTVWIAINTTAAVPVGTFALTRSDLNPVGLKVKAGDTISFITSDTSSQVGVKFYALQ